MVDTMERAPAEPAGVDPSGPAGSRPKAVGLIATVVVALLLIGGIGTFFWSETYKSPAGTEVAQSLGTITYNGKTYQHVSLVTTTYPDSTGVINGQPIHPSGNSGWPAYGNTNEFQVPANSYVTMTITQYDSGGAVNNPYFAQVHGTLSEVNGRLVPNVAQITGPNGVTKTVSAVDPGSVGHTFTLRPAPGADDQNPSLFVSVPLPTDASFPTGTTNGGDGPGGGAKAYTVKFGFFVGPKGTYAWNCEFPCGLMVGNFGAVMGAYGFMSGFLHVV